MCFVEFLIIPEIPGEKANTPPFPVPSASQTIPPPAFGLCNIAKYDLIRSRRASLNYSGPVPHFSEL